MELEAGPKLTKIIDDFTSAELLVSKDREGPLFLSRETDTMFILTAHTKGYRRRNIKIETNKDGTRIAISGEKPVQEMVMVGWKTYKKVIEMKGFRKAFRIPTGVVPDKIKAEFKEEESFLTISMPKLVKGAIVGGGIEEVKEEEVAEGVSETMLVADERETLQPEYHGESSTEDRGEGDTNVGKLSEASEIGRGKDDDRDQTIQQLELPSPPSDENLSDGSNQTAKPPKKKSKLCVPIMAGSAFLVSLIVFVIHLIKAKNQPSNVKAKKQ